MMKEFIQSNMKDADKLNDLVDEIKEYDIFDFITRVSALNLLIENQNKSVLFDALISGILAQEQEAYCGKIKMSSGKFRGLIRRMESFELRYTIDPPENAFVERVCYCGNHWIFPGINYLPGYTLQGFLDALCYDECHFDAEFRQKANQLIGFILQLSDSIIQQMGYGLDSIRSTEENNIKIPDAVFFERAKKCILVDCSWIESALADEALRQDLFIEFDKRDLKELNCTPFVRQYGILNNKWGVLLCQKGNRTRDIRQNSRKW